MASRVQGLDTIISEEEWSDALQEQLDEPSKWKAFCNVIFTDRDTINNPYHTDPSVSAYVRGTPYSYATMTQTNESITLAQDRIIALPIDEMTLAQSTYADAMGWAKRVGVLLDEDIETIIYADHAEWTDFTATTLTGAGVSITFSATNVDDFLRIVRRELIQNSAGGLLARNGGFVVWQPSDFVHLEGFMQANGFNLADKHLKDGGIAADVGGVYYGGFWHYASNNLPSGRCVAGVNKAISVYIMRQGYGKIKIIEHDPNNQAGIAIRGRVLFEPTVWNNLVPAVFDVATAATD